MGVCLCRSGFTSKAHACHGQITLLPSSFPGRADAAMGADIVIAEIRHHIGKAQNFVTGNNLRASPVCGQIGLRANSYEL